MKTTFNEAQLHLLEMAAHIDTPEALDAPQRPARRILRPPCGRRNGQTLEVRPVEPADPRRPQDRPLPNTLQAMSRRDVVLDTNCPVQMLSAASPLLCRLASLHRETLHALRQQRNSERISGSHRMCHRLARRSRKRHAAAHQQPQPPQARPPTSTSASSSATPTTTSSWTAPSSPAPTTSSATTPTSATGRHPFPTSTSSASTASCGNWKKKPEERKNGRILRKGMNERRKPIRHAERSRSIYSPRKRKGKRFFDKLRMTEERERMKVTDRRKENRLMKTMEFNEARRAAMARTILTTDDEAYTLPATLLRELMDTAAQQDAQGLTPDRRRTQPGNAAMVIKWTRLAFVWDTRRNPEQLKKFL